MKNVFEACGGWVGVAIDMTRSFLLKRTFAIVRSLPVAPLGVDPRIDHFSRTCIRCFLFRAILLLMVACGGGRASAADILPIYLPEGTFPVLEQILRDSADVSWRMMEEALRVEEARAEAEIAAAGKYPSVTGTFRYLGRIEDRDDLGTRSFYKPQTMLTARQPLYHWGALEANDRMGRLRTAMAESNRAEAYRLLALAIRGAFLDLAVRQKTIDVAKERLERAQQDLSAAETRLKRDALTAEELRRFALVTSEASLAVERLQRERALAMRDFSKLTGFDPVGDEWAPKEVPKFSGGSPSLPLAQERAGGPRSRPWEELSRLRIRQAEEQVVVEAARRRPQLDFVAGVAQDQVAVLDRADIDRTVYFAGLELTWNLFDGHETRGRQRAALARKRLEAQRHQRLERDSTNETERLSEAVEWAVRELEIVEERLELAGLTLSQREDDLRRGLISEAELGAARADRSEWELAATRRRAEYLMAVAEFLSAAGIDPAMDFYVSRQR